LGLTRLRTFLRDHPRIGIDTNIFIYALEAHATYVELSYAVLEWVEQLNHSAVTSTLTITEVLTQPYATVASRQVDEYYALLSNYPHVEWIAPDLRIAKLAARFRAQHRMRTPDAIQAATAVLSGATGFISNDPVFQRVDGFQALTLDDLL
jgi:predicted nucleic acid-binding protein